MDIPYLNSDNFQSPDSASATTLARELETLLKNDYQGDMIALLAGYQRILADNRQRPRWAAIHQKLATLFKCGTYRALDGPMIGVSVSIRDSDYFRETASRVWIPFHFLPANDGIGEGQNPIGSFINKLVCKPDSPIARQMVRQAILDRERPYELHRLGVTMHVYADTWAHQGFAGVRHKINEVEDTKETSKSGVFSSGLKRFIQNILDDAIPPLGHGRATVFPDMPFLAWSYTNGRKQVIQRDNTDQFCQAADQMCRAMQRYIAGDLYADTSGIGAKDMANIGMLFTTLKEKEGKKRHAAWLKAIADGTFSFGKQKVTYPGKCPGAWKEQALGTSKGQPSYQWNPSFMDSNWKYFHDALQAHQFFVIHDLSPKFGICAA